MFNRVEKSQDWSGSWSSNLYFSVVRGFYVLPQEEIQVLLHQATRGLSADRSRAKERLVEHHQGMILSIIKRFHPISLDEQMDWIQDCNMALCDAIDAYDPHRGAMFSTFAHTVLYRRMVDIVTKQYRSGNIRLPEPRCRIALEDDIDDVALYGIDTVNPEVVYVTRESKKRVRRILSSLENPRQRAMIQYRFGFIDGESHTLDEIADIHSITKARVGVIVRDGLEQIRIAYLTGFEG